MYVPRSERVKACKHLNESVNHSIYDYTSNYILNNESKRTDFAYTNSVKKKVQLKSLIKRHVTKEQKLFCKRGVNKFPDVRFDFRR